MWKPLTKRQDCIFVTCNSFILLDVKEQKDLDSKEFF